MMSTRERRPSKKKKRAAPMSSSASPPGGRRRLFTARCAGAGKSGVQSTTNEPAVDIVIRPLVGPEVLTGSTRLKAGTATKLVLNTITTLVMVQMGKVFENLMVDLRASNDKLWDRGARIVATLTGLDRTEAMQLLRDADGQVKRAVVMRLRQVDAAQADTLLERHGGRLREAIAAI
jgi:N-acetylmuramic acid 6-phosphate etherase